MSLEERVARAQLPLLGTKKRLGSCFWDQLRKDFSIGSAGTELGAMDQSLVVALWEEVEVALTLPAPAAVQCQEGSLQVEEEVNPQ